MWTKNIQMVKFMKHLFYVLFILNLVQSITYLILICRWCLCDYGPKGSILFDWDDLLVLLKYGGIIIDVHYLDRHGCYSYSILIFPLVTALKE